MKNKDNNRILVISLFAISIVIGLSSTLVGLLTTRITETYSLSYSSVGLMSTFYNFGGLVALLLMIFIADRISKQKIIWLLSLLFSISLLLMIKKIEYGICVLVITVLGICVSVINSMISAFIAEKYPNDNEKKINLVGVMFALGTIIGPVFTNILLADGLTWNQVFAYTGILGLVVLCLFNIGTSISKKSCQKQDETNDEDELIEVEIPKRRSRALIIVAIIVFLEIGQRCEFVSWFPTFIENKGWLATSVSYLMAAYYASELIGKSIYVVMIDKISFNKYTLIASLIGTISTVVALTIDNVIIVYISVLLLGISCGAIFPAGIACACKMFPESTGVMSTIVCLASNMGGVLFCYLTGIVADSTSMFTAGLLMPICLVLIMPLSLYLIKLNKEGRN